MHHAQPPALAFHGEVAERLHSERDGSGLAILGNGLGMVHIVRDLVQLHAKDSKLVFVLNLSTNEQEMIAESLLLGKATPRPHQQFRCISSELTVKERQKQYVSGGCFSVTNRILVVDFLNDLIPVDLVSGIVVTHAECVREDSTEAFIVRVFRSKSNGFVKAFSEKPQAFCRGFAKAQRRLQSLVVQTVTLWPRFHTSVQRDLGRNPPEIIELYPRLTPRMAAIQQAIGDVIQGCLRELKKNNKAALQHITSEDCLFRSAAAIVRAALLPIWDRVSPHSKSLVADLASLSRLLHHLLTHDCVSFYQLLETLRAEASGKGQSVWLFTEAANVMFTHARGRVFAVRDMQNVPLTQLRARVERQGGITPVLEPNPKWTLLTDVIREAYDEAARDQQRRPSPTNPTTPAGPPPAPAAEARESSSESELTPLPRPPVNPGGPPALSARVLVLAREGHTCALLRRWLEHGEGLSASSSSETGTGELSILQRRWVQFIQERDRGRKGPLSFDVNGRYHPKQIERIVVRLGLEREAKRVKKQQRHAHIAPRYGRAGSKRSVSSTGGSAPPQRKRPRERHEAPATPANGNRHWVQDNVSPTCLAGAAAPSEGQNPRVTGFRVDIHPFENAERALYEVQPSFVVLYDPDVATLRQVEVYGARTPQRPLKVYYLAYADSVETERYQATLERERRAFDTLIKQKDSLAVMLPDLKRPTKTLATPASPDDAGVAGEEGKGLLPLGLAYDVGIQQQNALTRRRGGQLRGRGPRCVVVDVREFRSGLPFFLYQRGLEVIPVTLEVGDYILSPSIAVERKSVSDLFQGLASGRLHNQLQALTKGYKTPVLLIEFSASRAFGFNTSQYANDGISSKDITSKLALITLHFPQVRFVWSKGPAFTAAIFEALKANEPEPTVAEALAVGGGQGADAGDVDSDTAREMLRHLPGVTPGNARQLEGSVGTLLQLTDMTHEDMVGLLGARCGRKLHKFIHEEIKYDPGG